jgi:hypothetical protein
VESHVADIKNQDGDSNQYAEKCGSPNGDDITLFIQPAEMMIYAQLKGKRCSDCRKGLIQAGARWFARRYARRHTPRVCSSMAARATSSDE